MKRTLERYEFEALYHYNNGNKVMGPHKELRGNVSGLRGDVDECELTEMERYDGIEITELVKVEK